MVMSQQSVSWGTYDIFIGSSVTVNLIRVKQSNSITASGRFGIIDTDYIKNITLDGCELNRFDAHLGSTNVNILNSKIGNSGNNLVGGGLFYMSNTTIVGSNNMFSLRPDYGTEWDGDIVVDDCTFLSSSATPVLIGSFGGGTYYGTVDFGYPSMLPRNVTFNRLTVGRDGYGSVNKIYVFADFLTSGYDNQSAAYPLGKPETVTIKDISKFNINNISIAPMNNSTNTDYFSDPSIVFNKSSLGPTPLSKSLLLGGF
jgi:hypothetical protein